MFTKSLIAIGLASLLLTGCATGGYRTNDVGRYSYLQKGVIEDIKTVQLEDSGVGTLAGAVIGGVIGSQFGGGKGKVVAGVAGAAVGGYAGNQLNKKVGQEMFVRLDNGNFLKHVSEGERFRQGDRISLEFRDNQIVNVTIAYN